MIIIIYKYDFIYVYIMIDDQKLITLSKQDKEDANELAYLTGISFSKHVRDMIKEKLAEVKSNMEL